MTDSLFDIIFRGDILPGHQLPEVKQKLAQLFKADEQKINSLFGSGAVALRRNLERAAAEKYRKVLANAGADVQVAAAGSVNTSAQRKAAPVNRPVRSSVVPVVPVVPEVPEVKAPALTLKERLAAEESAREVEGAASPATVDDEFGFSLSPPGVDLLAPSERVQSPEVNVDTSSLSLREQEGNLVDESEIARAAAVTIPDLNFDLSELGADLLLDSEKAVQPVVAINMPNADLAPVGSDLGQIKGEPPPPPPDTSGITVEHHS